MILILLFTFISCSSAPEFETATPPVWLADVSSFCEGKFLCAIGEGKTITIADSRARAELAKIFEVEVSSTLKASDSYQTGSAVNENYYSEVTESSEKTFENIKVLEHWKKKDSTEIYSLVGLDLSDAKSKVKDQLAPLIAALKSLTESGKRSDLIRAKKLYPQIYPLIAQWRILSNDEFNYAPKESEFIQFASRRFQTPIEMSFSWSGNSELINSLRGHLKDSLLKNGYSLGRSAIKYDLKAVVSEKDLPIKLDGFIKKEFDLSIDVYKDTHLVGNIHHHFKTTGKNWGQLAEKARLTFLKVIYDNLENLNIN